MHIDDRYRAARTCLGDGVVRAGGQHVAAEDQVRFAGGDALCANALRCARNAYMRSYGAVLLRHAGHVQCRRPLAFQVRGHAQQGTDGDDAGAADAGDEDVVRGVLEFGHSRCGQGLELGGKNLFGRTRLLRCAAYYGDKARTKAFHARIILVAGRLVDRALAAEFGFDRQDRGAIGLHAAVAAAFADRFVDEHALGGFRILALLAAPALLGRTGLVVDQYRQTPNVAQFTLHRFHVLAVVDRDHRRQFRPVLVARQVLGDHRDAFDAFRRHLLRDQADRNLPVHRLSAGHGYGIVVENLVGDIDLGRERRADREMAGMEIGAVAEIGEYMCHLRERCLPDPGRAFAAHLAGGLVVLGIDRRGHHVAANAGQRQTAFGYLGRGVVRAA